MKLSDQFWENEKRRLMAIFLPRLTQMALTGMTNAARQAGIAFDNTLYSQRAETWARTYTDKLLNELGTTTEKFVGNKVADWIATEGATVGDLDAALTPAFGATRANAIAVTETTRAFANGQEEAYKAEGITEWTWRTNKDELVCPYCGGANNKTVKIGEPFGHDRKGKPVTKPPFHPRCRCFVSPKISKDKPKEQTPNIEQAAKVKDAIENIALSLVEKFKAELPKDRNLKASINNAFKSIDKVLKIPDEAIHSIPIKETIEKRRLGATAINTITGESVYFAISKKGNHPELTMAHEFGHYVDNDVIGTKGSWSSKLGEIPGWHEAITNSQAYKDLAQLKQTGSVEVNGNTFKIDKDHVGYLLSDHELFARSFAQYISTKSGDTMMQEQVNKIRSQPMYDYGSRQWSDEDFKPIENMYDDYFKSIGWIP